MWSQLAQKSLCFRETCRRTFGAPIVGGRWTSSGKQLCFSTSSTSDSAAGVHVQQNRAKRRRRRGIGMVDSDDIPSYKEFVHKFTVISLYRGFLKEIRSMPGSQTDLKEQVQKEFKANKELTDPFNMQRSLTEGKRRLVELQELTGNKQASDADSWINTDDPEDPRGRVGTGWPWGRSDD